jgi:nucleoside-diphosphate-sugar epimerase
VLIVGCGYVGLPLGVELARAGHEVFGIRRSEASISELSRFGIQPIVADITQPKDLGKIPGQFDWAINAVSSTKGGADEYRAVYLEGTQRLIEWFSRDVSQRVSLRKYVHLSSTSVYAQADGSWVTEQSPTEPTSETSRVLVETERGLLHAATENNFPAIILRVAGIYGPERGHLFQQYLRGEARLEGDGSRFINMIHREDVVRAVMAALEKGTAGEAYNVADDQPVTQQEFFEWLSQTLRQPMPPPAGEAKNVTRKRGLTNKRVSNRKLRLELRCELKYPTFRQGYSAEIARLQAAGQLPVGPGQ